MVAKIERCAECAAYDIQAVCPRCRIIRAADQLPWWHPPYAAVEHMRMRAADLWDALFGRIETFCKIELHGSWFICEPHEAWEWTGTAPDGDVYIITEVRMTRRQFNNLPEFDGF